MKRKWMLAFSETAYYDISPVTRILSEHGYSWEATSNRDGDADYIYELFDDDGDCIWSDGDGSDGLLEALEEHVIEQLDRELPKGKPQVIVGDAVKIPFPRSSHVRS